MLSTLFIPPLRIHSVWSSILGSRRTGIYTGTHSCDVDHSEASSFSAVSSILVTLFQFLAPERPPHGSKQRAYVKGYVGPRQPRAQIGCSVHASVRRLSSLDPPGRFQRKRYGTHNSGRCGARQIRASVGVPQVRKQLFPLRDLGGGQPGAPTIQVCARERAGERGHGKRSSRVAPPAVRARPLANDVACARVFRIRWRRDWHNVKTLGNED
jgi:hypothetical protein